MQIFKQKKGGKTSSKKLKLGKKRFFSKKRFLPVALIFGVVGGYFVYQSFAYTPILKGSDGQFVALTPARIMDTRDGNGGYSVAIPANQTYTLQVAGRGGVPSTNVKAVVVNVTAVSPKANGFLTAWPSKTGKPTASSINYASGQTASNQVTVNLGTDGKLQFFSNQSTHIIVDVAGYYSAEFGYPGANFEALSPARVLDSRDGTGGFSSTITADSTVSVQIAGVGGVPQYGATAVVLNMTAVTPTSTGFATVWPSGISARPNASSINYASGSVTSKLLTVPIGADGKVQLYSQRTSHYVFDVAGYYAISPVYDSAVQSGRFVPSNTPYRIMDTRGGYADYNKALPAGNVYTLKSPSINAKAIVLNVTVVGPKAKGFLTVWPSGVPRPITSSLNFASGQTVSNQVMVKVGDDGKIQFYSPAETHIIVDYAGYFIDQEDNYGVHNTFNFLTTSGPVSSYERTITVDSLPNTPDTEVNLSLDSTTTQNTPDGSYKSFIPTTTLVPHAVNGQIVFTCYYMELEKCKNLSSDAVVETQTYGTRGHTTFKYPYNYSTGSYRVLHQVVSDLPGYPGKWVKTSIINPAGASKDLMMMYTNGDIQGGYNNSIYILTKKYSCSKPSLAKFKIGKILANGNPLPFEAYKMIDTFGSNCAGFGKVELNNTATDTSALDLFTSYNGIASANRDVKPPVIKSLTWNDATESLQLIAEDENSIVGYYGTGTNYYSIGGLPNSNKIDREIANRYSFNSSGPQTVIVEVRDNSGNSTTQTIQFTTR